MMTGNFLVKDKNQLEQKDKRLRKTVMSFFVVVFLAKMLRYCRSLCLVLGLLIQ